MNLENEVNLKHFYEYAVSVVEKNPGKYTSVGLMILIESYSKTFHKDNLTRFQIRKVIDDLVKQEEIYFKSKSFLGFKFPGRIFPV